MGNLPDYIAWPRFRRSSATQRIEPGRACGRQMDVPARPLGQPIADQRRLVGGQLSQTRWTSRPFGDVGLNLVEELSELGCSVTVVALSDHTCPVAMSSAAKSEVVP